MAKKETKKDKTVASLAGSRPWLKAQQFSFGWWQGLTAWWLRAFASRNCLGWLRSSAKSADLTIFAKQKGQKD
ncbi:hypothetical protein [Candidatus Enterococcus leclercqii]|uniref:hypothetical protein n=1 Tax=Candidatus Enterococcus leclercqii TaxID=1857218 RepID=UPI00137999E5|nr:hypothetical protein [Enterococcus sp. CU9D]KAF1294221.1 hypothetical protein BAU14_07485 [Enterococcus sp. CU9D]